MGGREISTPLPGLEIKEHQLEAATLTAASFEDIWVSFTGQELKGTFEEEVGVRRELADQHVCSGERVWE